MLLRPPASPEKDIDLRRTYDAVIVGSGAAGGMAAHVLTSHGLDVLLLEAGKKLDIESELKSMEWPYDHPRRGEKPYMDHPYTGTRYAWVRAASWAARPTSGAAWPCARAYWTVKLWSSTGTSM